MTKKQRKEERKICGETYQFIVDQIITLVDIEVGNYLYDLCGKWLHFNRYTNGGLDIYIFDPDYCSINKYGMIEFNDDNIDDILEVEHLHEDSMLWFILHFEKERVEMINRIRNYSVLKEGGEI